jgi:glucose-1-phosphate thymidylyltransferase
VKALLLAAGYATRLQPLTDEVAKPLLPVGGRPMADWIVDKIEESGEVDGIHVVTNAVYASEFDRWAEGRDVVVHNDGTTSNETRLGALGDIRLAVSEGAVGPEGLLVIAADNLFEFSLADFIAFWRGKGDGSALAVRHLEDPSLSRLYGIVELDEKDRVVGMQEKPERPSSDLAATAMYLFTSEHLDLLDRYIEEGNPPDPPGRFLAWLAEREPVYGFRFTVPWLDIGDPEQLLEADNRYRARTGLPERAVYSL